MFVVSARQLILIRGARDQLRGLYKNLREVDLVERASIIRGAADLLREVFGEVYNEDVLNSVFKGFCVGK